MTFTLSPTLPQAPATLANPARTTAPEITGFHAHVYFDATSVAKARALCEAAAARFPL
ncbi:MAG: Dopa 4,5-dioxygenase family, partial [Rhodoferax sp.]|nr:Dopa 4,5-dioxygenase family [Rhodoferax sp.]